MEAHVLGIGLCGPGLDGWTNAAPVLAGSAQYQIAPLNLTRATVLPATERRRAGRTVQLAVQVAQEAVTQSAIAPSDISTVFASSGGDLETVQEICLALARPEKLVSPTRFHSSVHNAAAGYWSIATGARAPSTGLSCYDGTFAAGLLEALGQLHSGAPHVLLVAYDSLAPEPLHAKRPLAASFGVALLLSVDAAKNAYGKLRIAVTDAEPASRVEGSLLESLRAGVPAARAMSVLAVLASRESRAVCIDYLDDASLEVDVTCR